MLLFRVEQRLLNYFALVGLVFEVRISNVEFCGPRGDALFEVFVYLPGLGGSEGNVPHFAHSALNRDDKEGIFEYHPPRVFEPAPFLHGDDSVNRLRPEKSAYQVIGGDDQRSRHKYPPIAVERQKCK